MSPRCCSINSPHLPSCSCHTCKIRAINMNRFRTFFQHPLDTIVKLHKNAPASPPPCPALLPPSPGLKPASQKHRHRLVQ
eukprot:768249-Hanusia_phi.AAC.3